MTFIMTVPNEGYSRNSPCAIYYIYLPYFFNNHIK